MMKKAYVGLSGGVDSAVSAALLKQQGFDVTGVFIKIWSPEFIECTWRDDRLDAMRAAVHLGIPFKEIDLSERYRSVIIEKMVSDYKNGVTPNPDVLCNSVIKFGAFYEWAREHGADLVATGHYAQVKEDGGIFRLLRGKDLSKDQSYFIYELTQSQLKHIRLPVGGMLKSEVREIARRISLPVATKPDSQGLCFVGDITLQEFLSRFIQLEKGAVLDENANEIGEHDGAALFTLGQRHGFRARGTAAKSPLYVIAIDVSRNTITVSPDRSKAARIEIGIQNPSWTTERMKAAFSTSIQTRYREPAVPASVRFEKETLRATFDSKHLASPGQAAVFYCDDEVVGGGTIL